MKKARDVSKKDKMGHPLPPQPPQKQSRQPGRERQMDPAPQAEEPSYKGSGKLKDKVAIITGGDSGIGKAVAIAFAKEGANSVIVYLNEHDDAKDTQREVEKRGQHCLCIAGDIGNKNFCSRVIEKTIKKFGRLDIVINNAAEQHPMDNIEDISQQQLEKTFRTNIFSFFYLTQAAMPYLNEGSSIINSTSVVAYHGNPQLLDYSATKGAIVAFTRSLSLMLIKKGIRVNAVAPGPIWTPLIPSTFSKEKVSKFGEHVPMKRPGQPSEIATCYVFLASNDASYISGQVLHPNGGVIVNG